MTITPRVSAAQTQSGFASLAQEFLEEFLALSPVAATQVGYHLHRGQALDEMLDDYSAAGIRTQKEFLLKYRRRFLGESRKKALGPEDRADLALLRDTVEFGLLEMDAIQSYRHNPTVYVELAGNALFLPLVLEYAPREERLRHLAARMEKMPALFQQARANLVDTDPIYTKVALEEDQGNLGLIQQVLEGASGPEKPRLEAAAARATKAFQEFNKFLETDLAKRPTGNWRLGAEKYRRKLRLALGTDMTPAQVLAAAEQELRRLREEMYRAALPLYSGPKGDNPDTVIRAALDQVAAEHVAADRLKADVVRQLEEVRAFVREKNIITLSPRENLQVIDTPEFMRGIFGVAGFQPAPPLEPKLGAFYWVTPIPPDWPAERKESKLREYNNYMLRLITIHEAIPGHYIQFEHANSIEPRTRRLVRAVFGNGPYVEGWAVYITRVLVEEGYLAPPGQKVNSKLLLTLLKSELRAVANAILDVRMHTRNMTDQEAMDLMIGQTFQERAEAEAKLQRAKLSSTQLPTYFVGLEEWLRLREEYRKKKGSQFRLQEFHDSALDAGALPLPTLRRLMIQ